jgi:cyclohexa-1,5-dienecarbonyl-CoA hydratase
MSGQPAPPVRLERQGRAAFLVLDRPPLNILDLEAIAALDRSLESLSALAVHDDLQLVVLRGAGGRAFSAGVSVQDHTPDKVGGMLESFHRAIRRLHDLEAITLAAVAGHCLGGGMELAMTCDLLLASESSRFGQPEIQLGCYPPAAAALYPRKLGHARTFDLLLTGRTLACEEAERCGVVTWRVSDAEFEERLQSLVADLTGKSTAVTRLTKRAIRAGIDLDFREAVAEAERLYLDQLTRTEDMEEGIRAFLEKRPPRWKHR